MGTLKFVTSNLKHMALLQITSTDSNVLGVVTRERIPPGTTVMTLRGQLCCFRTRKSVELAGGVHVEDPVASFINHSFSPNCIITPRGELITLVTVFPGEELTTNYLQHESEISCPFIDSRTRIEVK